MTDSRESKRLQPLLASAREVSERAYSPYSGARVGAAVACADGRVFSGCNVENASYGLTQCAERNAIGAAIAAGVRPREIQEIAVFAHGFERLSPCGACRQVMAELLAEDALVHCANEVGKIDTFRVTDLLPEPFVLD